MMAAKKFFVKVKDDYRWSNAQVAGRQFSKRQVTEIGETAMIDEIRDSEFLVVEEVPYDREVPPIAPKGEDVEVKREEKPATVTRVVTAAPAVKPLPAVEGKPVEGKVTKDRVDDGSGVAPGARGSVTDAPPGKPIK
jgi:hypothetical protein